MPYFPVGDDSTGLAFNATRFPGIAYATNKPTEEVYYNLQRQLNRVIYASPGIRGHKNSMMIEDSLIGADTVRAILAVLGKAVTFEDAAKNAEFYRNAARLVADQLRAPDSPPGVIRRAPRSSLPPAAERAATDLAPPGPPPGAGASILDSFKNMDTTTMIALAAAAVGIGYYVTKKPKSNPAKRNGYRVGVNPAGKRRRGSGPSRRTKSAAAARPRTEAEQQRELAKLYRKSRPKWIVRRGKKFVALNPSRRFR